ncbi:Uncharacterised protein [Mycobacteroides abscessus subsp. massiliense]|nr:Uncharacterised protein [Mycobacteroides abscessus subsp. massiliense]
MVQVLKPLYKPVGWYKVVLEQYILQVVLRVPVELLGKSNARSQFMNLSFHNFLNGRLLQEKEKTLQ